MGADDKVFRIITADARFHTCGGARPGAAQISARVTLGTPRCVENRADTPVDDEGAIYLVAGNVVERVKRIGVIANKCHCPQF